MPNLFMDYLNPGTYGSPDPFGFYPGATPPGTPPAPSGETPNLFGMGFDALVREAVARAPQGPMVPPGTGQYTPPPQSKIPVVPREAAQPPAQEDIGWPTMPDKVNYPTAPTLALPPDLRRKRKKGSLLQTLGWALASLAAPNAVAGYLTGTMQGEDKADEDAWKRYAAMNAVNQQNWENEVALAKARELSGDSAFDRATKLKELDLQRIYQKGVIDSRNDPENDFQKYLKDWQNAYQTSSAQAATIWPVVRAAGLRAGILLPEEMPTDPNELTTMANRRVGALGTAANITGNPDVGNALISAATGKPAPTGDPYAPGGSVYTREQQANLAAIREQRQYEATRRRLDLEAARLGVSQGQLAVSQQRLQLAAMKQQMEKLKGRKLNQGEIFQLRAQNSHMSPTELKQWVAMGGAPGPQARDSMSYWIGLKVLRMDGSGKVSWAPRVSEDAKQKFLQDQRYWANGRFVYGGPGVSFDRWDKENFAAGIPRGAGEGLVGHAGAAVGRPSPSRSAAAITTGRPKATGILPMPKKPRPVRATSAEMTEIKHYLVKQGNGGKSWNDILKGAPQLKTLPPDQLSEVMRAYNATQRPSGRR